MFDIAEINVFTYGPFTPISSGDDFVHIQSEVTNQFWLIKKFDSKDLPKMVLYHAHYGRNDYHVHCVYDSYDAFLCYKEIVEHDSLITKRKLLREKLTKLSNKELVAAALV